MIESAYPWKWLSDNVGSAFVLRFPWIEMILRAAREAQSVCLLLPEVAGPLPPWERWLVNRIDDAGVRAFLHQSGDFRELARELSESYTPEQQFADESAAVWSRRFLAECRRSAPHCDTIPLLVTDADDACVAALRELVRAQRELGYPFARPILLRRAAPSEWDGEVVRFGLPEWVGDLNRIAPPPTQDMGFWTNLLLALTVAWEAGAIPQLADELWERLHLRKTVSMRDTNTFDSWLERELSDFAKRNQATLAAPLPSTIAFGPLRSLSEEEAWHRGAIAWEGNAFDVTPLQARHWTVGLDADALASLRRRRLTNLPLARWLSAWAASIEESLKIAVLQAGSARFRSFLDAQPPWQKNSAFRSRLDVDRAQFGDLTAFLAKHPPRLNAPILPGLLESCRVARNRVVHQRLVCTEDFLNISNLACWLNENIS
jgi:hypothetical protein